MNVEKIYYQRNFPIGQFLFETIGIGITINGNEDAQHALDEAKRLVCEYNEKNNPHLQSDISSPLPPEPKELPTLNIDRPIGRDEILEGIKAAADATDLNGYKLLVKNNKVWADAYATRAKELRVIA
jgi:hypothetical protein